MKRSPQFLYFDLGNVLVTFDHHVMCQQIADVAGVEVNVVRKVILEDDDLQVRTESGLITLEEFHNHFCQATSSRPDYRPFIHAASAIFEINLSMIPLLTQLALTGHRLGVLSNTNAAHWNYCSSGRFGAIPRLFEKTCLSYEVKAMKPHAAIFDAAIDMAGVPASQVFFVDDLKANVAGALAAGMDAVLFTDVRTLVKDLRERNVQFNY